MSEPINEAWCGMFRGGKYGQHGSSIAIVVITPSSAQDALTVLRQHREATISTGAEPCG